MSADPASAEFSVKKIVGRRKKRRSFGTTAVTAPAVSSVRRTISIQRPDAIAAGVDCRGGLAVYFKTRSAALHPGS
jgi:hypothetical protein